MLSQKRPNTACLPARLLLARIPVPCAAVRCHLRLELQLQIQCSIVLQNDMTASTAA